jgi:hypothetical protein
VEQEEESPDENKDDESEDKVEEPEEEEEEEEELEDPKEKFEEGECIIFLGHQDGIHLMKWWMLHKRWPILRFRGIVSR